MAAKRYPVAVDKSQRRATFWVASCRRDQCGARNLCVTSLAQEQLAEIPSSDSGVFDRDSAVSMVFVSTAKELEEVHFVDSEV